MTQKSKRAPVNQNPIADRVIPNPANVHRGIPVQMQIFHHMGIFS
jgi:hypothetical protein